MALGLALKTVGGALKGGAKKIATDKLLNRKKKTDARRQKAQQVMGGGEESGGALAITPKTSMIPSPAGAIVKYTDDSSDKAKAGDSAETLALKIKTSIISVETLLGNSVAFQKKKLDEEREARDQKKLAEQEKELEKKEPKESKGKGLKLKLPGGGILNSIIKFASNILFGYVMVRLVDFLPKLQTALPKIGAFVDGFLDFSGKVLNIFATLIDFGYKLVEMGQNLVKNLFGEEGLEKFNIFMDNLKNLINGFIAWKLIGEKIFKAIVSSIKGAFNLAKNIIKGALGIINKLTGGLLSKTGNIISKGVGALSKGVGAVAGKVSGFASKIFGPAAKSVSPALKATMPAVKGFAKRIPILGPIIVGLVSLLSGEPASQALFKTFGAGLGGALGSFIPIPVLGTLIGETIGVYVGDLLYELILGGGVEAVGNRMKEDFTKLLSGGKIVFNWLKDGVGRFLEGLPKGFGLAGFLFNPNPLPKVKLMGKAFFSREPMKEVKDDDKSDEKSAKLSNNQKKDSNKVADDVSKKATYEEPEVELIPIEIPPPPSTVNMNESSTTVASNSNSSKEDFAESLYMTG